MEKKHYNTAGRQRLASYLKETKDQKPQTAEEIYQGLSVGQDAPGRSSVYRMLTALCSEGQVKKFPAGNGEGGAVYQYVGNRTPCHAHFHLHCLLCGDVTHLECGCSEEIAGHLQKSHGFSVDRGQSVLYGTCARCLARGREE